jgi:hypothetical protein
MGRYRPGSKDYHSTSISINLTKIRLAGSKYGMNG